MRIFTTSILATLFSFQSLLGQTHPQLIPYRLGDKWGYCTANKQIVIQPLYDAALPFNGSSAVVYLNKHCGVINQYGKLIIPLAKQELLYIGHRRFIKAVLKGSDQVRKGLINLQNKILLPFEYNFIRWIDGVLDVEKADKYGVVDTNGTIILEPVYDMITHSDDGSFVVRKGNLCALFNANGKQLSDFKYKVIDDFRDNLSKIRVADRFGFIDKAGKERIPPTYEMTWPYSDGYAVVMNDGKYGLIDTLGKSIIPLKYDFLGDTHLGVASFQIANKWGLVLCSGKEVTKAQYDEVRRTYNGIIAVKQNEKWAIITPDGKLLTDYAFDSIDISTRDEAAIRDFGVKDTENDKGYLLVAKANKWGAVDSTGKLILNTEFDEIYPFTHHTALVSKKDKWAVADAKGNIKTPFIYDGMNSFISGVYNLRDHGIIISYMNEKSGLLSADGKEIVPPIYDYILPSNDNYYMVSKEQKWGVIDSLGQLIIPIKYNKIQRRGIPFTFSRVLFIDNLCYVELANKPGYVS